MTQRLLIVGGSVRAAAMSAQRAGFEPLAIDRFADADLRRLCNHSLRFDELDQLPELARCLPLAEWIFAGPLENYPAVLDRLAADRKLLGNPVHVLNKVRNPWRVANVLGEFHLRFPQVRRTNELPSGGEWLRKPLDSAGGCGIERLSLTSRHGLDREAATYLQQLVPGTSIGATFIAASGGSVLVGVAEQLLGSTWGGSRPYQYVGSIGPVVLSIEQTRELTRIGECLAQRFQLQGLFGIDAVVNDEGIWPVEVNPRYTASVEILERALNFATIRWHVEACRRGKLPEIARENSDRSEQHGKAVFYATHEFAVDAKMERELVTRNREHADRMIADIPVAGTHINRGAPVVTVFAKGKTSDEVRDGLRAAIAGVTRLAGAA